MTENEFIKKCLKPELDSRNLWWSIKEAKSVRGLPDIWGCYNGKFFAMEVKKDAAEASKNTGRIALQKYTLRQIDLKGGGLGYIVHPGNLQEILDSLDYECSRRPYQTLPPLPL